MKRPYVVPSSITALGLAVGLFIIFRATLIDVEVDVKGLLISSSILLLLAGFFDMMDGMVARALRAESDFGLNFDSLADAITFGIVPSVLFLKTIVVERETFSYFALIGAAMIFSMCGVLRLVRFNVKSKEGVLSDNKSLTKSLFTGLPIPAAALAAVSLNLLMSYPYIDTWINYTEANRAYIVGGGMIILSYLMISLSKFPNLRTFAFHFTDFRVIVSLTVVALLLIYGLVHSFAITLFILTWGYIFFGLGYSWTRFLRVKK